MMEVSDGLIPAILGDDEDRATCPVCGMAIRMNRMTYYKIDRYEAQINYFELSSRLPPQDPEVAEKLRKEREGKKTVAMVGLAPSSCSLAPYDDPDVEIWTLNEAHAFRSWLKRWDRWFQIHDSKSWKRAIARRDVTGHYKWLRQFHYGDFDSRDQPTEHEWQDMEDVLKEKDGKKYILSHEEWHLLKPIYMQYWNSEIPNSAGYPIKEVSDNAFANFRRGDAKVKYFTSTLAYMFGIATLPEEGIDRIELYGYTLSDDVEYLKQKACAEWWIGFAMGRGIEVYVPPESQIMFSSLYGGDEQGAGW